MVCVCLTHAVPFFGLGIGGFLIPHVSCLMRAVPFFGLGLVDVRVTFIPVARGLFKLVGEVGISLDFVSELSRTKSITFPS